MKPRVPAVARAVIALALLGASAAGAADVGDHEAPGNLESTHDLGCVGAARLSSAHTPPDLYRALEKCVQQETYDDATLLFALAGPATTTRRRPPETRRKTMAERVPLLEVGKLLAGLEDLKAKKGEPPWSEPVVLTDDIQAFIICHPPGQPNDTHYHLHDEWWIVLQGEIDWYIEDEPAPIHARAGDFILGPKSRWHHIEPVGSEPTIRIAINARGEFHRYDRPGCKPL